MIDIQSGADKGKKGVEGGGGGGEGVSSGEGGWGEQQVKGDATTGEIWRSLAAQPDCAEKDGGGECDFI